MKQTTFTLALSLAALPSIGAAATLEELEARITQLEEELALTADESKDNARALSDMATISGYADVEFYDKSGKDNDTSFRIHHISLFLKKQLSDKIRFFSEIEFEDAAKIDNTGGSSFSSDSFGKLFVEAVSIDYLANPMLNFRFGRFFTPAGIWNIDHYPPFVPTQERPLHIRNMFPQLNDGALVYGAIGMGSTVLSYDLYTGNGIQDKDRYTNPKEDGNATKALGTRLTFAFPVLDLTEIGVSYLNDKFNSGNSKISRGVHAKAKFANVTLQAEGAHAKNYNDTAIDNLGYYLQAMYDWNQWTFGGRYDVYDSNRSVDDDETLRKTAFVNYHFTKDVVAKLEYHRDSNDSKTPRSSRLTMASIAVNLGN
ncbi:MAG: porin [Pseudomonadota bacterium]